MSLPEPDHIIPDGTARAIIEQPGNWGFEGACGAAVTRNVEGVHLYGLNDNAVITDDKLRIRNARDVTISHLAVRHGIRAFDEEPGEQSGNINVHHVRFDMLESDNLPFQVSPRDGGHIHGIRLADSTFRCRGEVAYIGLYARQRGAVAGVEIVNNYIEACGAGFNIKNLVATPEYPRSIISNNTIFYSLNDDQKEQAAIYLVAVPDEPGALLVERNLIGARWASDGTLEHGRINGAGIHLSQDRGRAIIAANLVLNCGGTYYQDGIHMRRPNCTLLHNTTDRTMAGVGLFVADMAVPEFVGQNNALDSVNPRAVRLLDETNLIGYDAVETFRLDNYYPLVDGLAYRTGILTALRFDLESSPFAEPPSIGALEFWPKEPEELPRVVVEGAEYWLYIGGQRLQVKLERV